MWHLVTGVIGDCLLSEGLVGGQCLLWATVFSLAMSLHGIRFFWGDNLKSPGTGTLALTMSPSLEQLCTLSSHDLTCLRRLMSAGCVGGDICVPYHVMLTQLRALYPYLPLPLCNLSVVTSLLTAGGQPCFPFLVSREQQTVLLPSGVCCHNV